MLCEMVLIGVYINTLIFKNYVFMHFETKDFIILNIAYRIYNSFSLFYSFSSIFIYAKNKFNGNMQIF